MPSCVGKVSERVLPLRRIQDQHRVGGVGGSDPDGGSGPQREAQIDLKPAMQKHRTHPRQDAPPNNHHPKKWSVLHESKMSQEMGYAPTKVSMRHTRVSCVWENSQEEMIFFGLNPPEDLTQWQERRL